MKKVRLDFTKEKVYPCIPDEGYEKTMKEKVEPYVNQWKEEGWYEREKGKFLYYEGYRIPGAVGTVIISHGYTESIEKYREVIYYFLKEHYHVFLLEHRGHGRSFRDTESEDVSLTHINDYEEYVEDFHGFIEEIVVQAVEEELPFYIYAHSMGGAIAARYLQMYPGRIRKAVLSTPMLGIQLGMPEFCAAFIARTMIKAGRKEAYIISQKAFSSKSTFEENYCSDKARFAYYMEKRISNRKFQNNAGSYSWLNEALRMIHAIRDEKRQIQIPVCIFSAEKDSLVTRKGQLDLARKTPDSRLVLVEQSKHEIYMAPVRIQEQYWRYLFGFLREDAYAV